MTNLTTERINELQRSIIAMQEIASKFYHAAIHVHNHPFIEFNGLMTEYIKCCETALAEGVDFTLCNVHTGKQLPMFEHQVRYTNEKLECIYTGRSVLKENTTVEEYTFNLRVQHYYMDEGAEIAKILGKDWQGKRFPLYMLLTLGVPVGIEWHDDTVLLFNPTPW